MFALSVGLWAADDPAMGTWELNLAKSKNDPGPPNKSNALKYEPAGNDGMKQTGDGVSAQGNPTHTGYTAKYDGNDYPYTGSADYDTIALQRIDASTSLTTNKKNGTVVRMLRRTLSKDGRSMTLVSVGINAKGQAFHNVAIYDKQ
jgi:hypothetical protein